MVVSPVLFVVLEMLVAKFFLCANLLPQDLTLVNVAGVLVSLLTVFRTQQAYNRYWEARSALGRLLAAVVDTASTSGALLHTIGGSRERLASYLRLYAHEVTGFLRETSAQTKARSEYWRDEEDIEKDVEDALAGLSTTPLRVVGLDHLDVAAHAAELDKVAGRTRSILVLRWVREELYHLAVTSGEKAGGLSHTEVQIMLANSVLPSLTSLQTEYNACAKVASTPFPRAYMQMDRLLRFAYVYTMPIWVCSKVGSEAVPLVAILAFGFYGLDAVANQLQHPFVSTFGDAALDGRFTKAVCDDVDAVLLAARCPSLDVNAGSESKKLDGDSTFKTV